MKTQTYRKARVTGDWDEKVYDAEVLVGQRWNGWAIPRFTKGIASAVVEGQAEMIRRHGADSAQAMEWDGDVIVVSGDIYGEEDLRIAPDPDGFYHIGGWEWCWSVVEGDDE